MGRLNTIKRLVIEDYPKNYQDLLQGLFFVLNQYLEQVYSLFNKGLNFNDNFQALDTEATFTAPANNFKVQMTLKQNPKGCMVLRVDDLTDSSAILTSAPFVQFTNSSNEVIINNITGLVSGHKYRVRLVFFV